MRTGVVCHVLVGCLSIAGCLSMAACQPRPAPADSASAAAPRPAPAPAPVPVSTKVDAPRSQRSLALDGCETAPHGKLHVVFPDNYSAEDVARWLIGWSCRQVIVPTSAQLRRGKGIDVTVEASELPRVLGELLGQFDLFAISENGTTVFVEGAEAVANAKADKLVWAAAKASEPSQASETRDTPPSTAESNAVLSGITKTGERRYTIKKSALEGILANPALFARGARIVPSIKDGKPNGFKLYAIRPSSIYAKLGLMNGDTLVTINGYRLDTPDKALEVYTKLREATKLAIEIVRRGKLSTLTYVID